MNKSSVYVIGGAAIVAERMALREIVHLDCQRWIGGMEHSAVGIGHASYVQNLVENELALNEESSSTSCSTTLSASDLAAEVLGQLKSSKQWLKPSNIIYTHSSIDEAIASSPACRMQLLAEASQAVPLSVSQQEEVSGFLALWLASAYLARAQPEAIALVISAEKWIPPQVRWHPPHPPFGDGACALLLAANRPPAHDDPCIRISNVQVQYLWDGIARDYRRPHILRITEALRGFISGIEVSPQALIAPTLQVGVCDAISQVIAIPHLPAASILQGLNLAAAHPLADIALRLDSNPYSANRVVSWNITPGGHFAAMLVEQLPVTSSSPSLSKRNGEQI